MSGRALAGVLVLALAVGAHAAPPATAPIVGGTLTGDYPAVGAYLLGTTLDATVTQCSGVLVGCATFVTAAHCVCAGTGLDCQGAGAPSPAAGFVWLDHAGFLPIADVVVHPAYAYPTADVAVLRLATPVTGVVPAAIADVAPAVGTGGTIVGFGVASTTAGDSGLKRAGAVVTAPCAAGIDGATSVCWDYTGAGANTCAGDSGGPLFVGGDVAGVTSGGFATTCLPVDHSYDASLAVYRDWIVATAAGDVGTQPCGALPAVGTAGAAASAFAGDLGVARPFELQSVGVAPGTSELRVGMHGSEKFGVDFDLYVRGGAAPAPGLFGCRAVGGNQYGFCTIANPAPGSWFLRAERVAGDGVYQIVATTFGGAPAVCGNGIREPGESCDGADVGTCTTGCDAACSCVTCSETDLDVTEIVLAPRLVVQATLGDEVGTYTNVDPRAAGVTMTFADAARTIVLALPPNDPGWVVANPNRGRYRWRGDVSGLRRLVLRARRKHPTDWMLRARGKHVPGADAIDYGNLIARVELGRRCAERRFHAEQTPAIPR
jgi:trypsin